ncbi:MAG: hypothetical protein M1374_06720 [Firmicutes bacterium]|nr:hypothetical protein [Bacillota bacterium]
MTNRQLRDSSVTTRSIRLENKFLLSLIGVVLIVPADKFSAISYLPENVLTIGFKKSGEG